MEQNIIQFSELKLFRTDFKLNEKESSLYFEKALITGVPHYLEQVKAQGVEMLHILYSWSDLFKYISFGLVFLVMLGLSSFEIPQITNMILLFASLCTMLVSRLILRRYIMVNFELDFTIAMLKIDDCEELNKQRLELIKN